MVEPKDTPAPSPSPEDDWAVWVGDQLLAAQGAAREALLAELIEREPERADELRRICAALTGVDRLLDDGFADPAGNTPREIGAHSVLRRLGEGAFGVVYLCAQERPVKRHVAIKVLRPGAGDLKTLQRFAAERQLLAQLNHPGITQIFDAGELPDGRPYFVMEYVDGAPIHEWCVAHRHSCADRVRLFIELCRAVSHAHSRGIVHRDLKPANVLVVTTPDGPMPKVIDFGIAKALVGSEQGIASRTETGRVVGTPGYMSPEQAAGHVDQVDARCDVFALGVMLYQLLTDRMPWDEPTRSGTTDPILPSARVSSSGKSTPRGTSPTRATELRGDLDWITMTAIARERDDRYPSVEALLRDLERHLRNETVSVGPPALPYRMRKFVQRHRGPVLAVGALLIAIVGSLSAWTYARQVSAESGIADSKAIVARLLERANDPALFGTAHGDEVRKALGAEALTFAEDMLAKHSGDPTLLTDRCEALLTIADVQRLVGESAQSLEVARRAVAIARELFDARSTDDARRGLLGSALREEARALAMGGDLTAAEAQFVAAIEYLDACVAAGGSRWRAALATTTSEMATVIPAREIERAVQAYERSIALFEQLQKEVVPMPSEWLSTYARACLGLCARQVDLRRFHAAAENLALATSLLPDCGWARLSLTIESHRLRSILAWEKNDRSAALEELAAAADVADQWCREQPRRNPAHRVRTTILDQLAQRANYAGDFARSTNTFRRAIAAAEQLIAEFPNDPTAPLQLQRRHYQFAHTLWDRFRLAPLAEAADQIARAIAIDDRLGKSGSETRLARWQLITLQAEIARSRGDAGAPERWREVEALVPLAVEPLDYYRGVQVEAFLGIADERLREDDLAAAATWLTRARAIVEANRIHAKLTVEIAWREAQIAFRNREVETITAAAERILKARPTWLGFRRAADCLRLAAACVDEASASGELRARAREHYGRVVAALDADVLANPDDPWFLVPWGAAQIRLAHFAADAGDRATASDLLDRVLPILDIARVDAHHDQWDKDAYRAGVELRDLLRR
ncbi:MAG: protein kinase [Planctomycetota bacterium]